MPDRVALVGVGAMGRALLKRLRAAGKHVQAYDIDPAARDAAAADGAIVARSPAAAAQDATVVHVIVASDEDVLQATMGTDGVLAGASAGAIVLLHSTILPATTKTVADAAAGKGVHVLDAPVGGVPRRLEEGQSTFLLGGPADLVDSVRPHLLSIAKAVHHFGPLGAGNVAKLAKNLLNAGERVLLAEILRMVAAGGLDVRQFLDMQIATEKEPAVAMWSKNFSIVDGHAVPRPTTNLFGKDVRLAVELSRSLALDTPVTEGVGRTAAAWIAEWGQAQR